MRVLTVGNMFPPHARGGYERMWAAAVDGLRAAGHDVTVLTTRHREPLVHADDPPHVFRSLHWHWADDAFVRRGWRERRRLERDNADLLRAHPHDHVQWWAMGGMSLSLLGCTDAPSLAVVHDGWPTYAPRFDPGSRGGRWPHERIGWWSFNSAYSRDLLARAGVPFALERSSVDHPGIDLAAFPPSDPPATWSGRLALVGRVEPRKGVEVAVAALDRLPGARLVVAGAGDVPAHPRVDALGPVADPARVYAAADAVLFPVTWAEPFGLVPLEAMAVGRPVVATATGGSAEFLVHEENCLVVAPEDDAALAGAVVRLAEDPALRGRLVDGGRATAQRFALDRFTTAIVAHAERLA